ncbi:MAG: PAS domain S-box protein [Anaerolineales bacterium]|nr:PAS domain S-box protein [Anaerolineales bacterium]
MSDQHKSKQQLIQELTQLRRQVASLQERQQEADYYHQMWETLMTNTPDLIYFKDAQHGLIKASQAYAQVVGADTTEELVGKTAADLWPREAEEIMADERRVLDGEPMTQNERKVTTASGQTRWFLLTKIPIYQEDKIIGFFALDKDITDRKRAEKALLESESRFRRIYESNMIGISYWDHSGKITNANQAYLDMVGCSREDITSGKITWSDITPSEYSARDQAAVQQIVNKGICAPYEKEYIKKDGSRIPVLIGGAALEGEEHLGITFAIDISDRKGIEEELKERKLYLESILKAAPDAIVTLDAEQRIVEWNPGARGLFGYSSEEAVGKQLDELITREEILEEAVKFTQQVQGGKELPATEVIRYRKDGTPVEVILAGSPILVNEEMTGAIGIYTDISDRVRMEKALRAMALRDDLTGLYNRRGFTVLAEQHLKMASREKRRLYLLYADMDNLKAINDRFGHPAGDRALQAVSQIMETTFRKSDVLARIGGDEFVILAMETEEASPEILNQRFQEAVKNHNQNRQHGQEIAVSVGWCIYDPANPCSLEELIILADKAMYLHKIEKSKT